MYYSTYVVCERRLRNVFCAFFTCAEMNTLFSGTENNTSFSRTDMERYYARDVVPRFTRYTQQKMTLCFFLLVKNDMWNKSKTNLVSFPAAIVFNGRFLVGLHARKSLEAYGLS